MEASSREASLSNAARAELYPASSLAGDRTRDGLSGVANVHVVVCVRMVKRAWPNTVRDQANKRQ